MKIPVTSTLAGALLAATMLCAACSKEDAASQMADTAKTDAAAQELEKPASPVAENAVPDKALPDKALAPKSADTCLSLKATAPERLKALFKNEKKLLPVEVSNAGLNWGTTCRYWEEGRSNLHQLFIKTNATAESFKKMKKETVDAIESMKPMEAKNAAFDDLFFFEFKTRWFSQVTIHARKGNNQLVTTAKASKEELMDFTKEVFSELK